MAKKSLNITHIVKNRNLESSDIEKWLIELMILTYYNREK